MNVLPDRNSNQSDAGSHIRKLLPVMQDRTPLTLTELKMNIHCSLHFFLTPEGKKIEYARIQRKMGRTWIGQTIHLSRLDNSLVKTIRCKDKVNAKDMSGIDGDF